jgi:hypothetical protein
MSGRCLIMSGQVACVSRPRFAPAGALAWAVGLLTLRPGWPEAILLLASLVIVPLGLGLVVSSDLRDGSRPWRMAVRLQFPAALALTASMVLPVGVAAVLLAIPWLVTTGLVALHGLWRLRRGPHAASEVCLDAGLLYLAVGGIWTAIARAGLRPLGFPDLIVLLTAVHFHYAGFALLVLASLVARALGGPTARAACLGVIAGVPLVAAGITDAQLVPGILPPRLLELVASVIMGASSILVGLLQLRLAARTGMAALARALMAVSGLSLLAPMVLAGLYALGSFEGAVRLDIPAMLHYHGAVNALGFALPGVLSWHVILDGRKGVEA